MKDLKGLRGSRRVDEERAADPGPHWEFMLL